MIYTWIKRRYINRKIEFDGWIKAKRGEDKLKNL